jgi:hypothetical protein
MTTSRLSQYAGQSTVIRTIPWSHDGYRRLEVEVDRFRSEYLLELARNAVDVSYSVLTLVGRLRQALGPVGFQCGVREAGLVPFADESALRIVIWRAVRRS